jgi:hypothetical protein
LPEGVPYTVAGIRVTVLVVIMLVPVLPQYPRL